MWFGESKPLMSTFGRPLLSSLKNLEENGIIVTEHNEKEVLCKAFLICTTADLPAKCHLMNVNKFNSAVSCSMCLQNCTTHRSCKGGSVHIYP